MRTDVIIHKQVFDAFAKMEMRVPIGTRLVDAAEDYEQTGSISIWYERPEVAPGEQQVQLFIIPTGNRFDAVNNNAEYFKTIHMKNGLVWHLYVGRIW